MIAIKPQLFKQFGEANQAHFRLITNSSIADQFRIDNEGLYKSTGILICDDFNNFSAILVGNELPKPLHMLIITPDSLFLSPDDNSLGKQVKLLVMPCNSTAIDIEDIKHFVASMEKTDIVLQKKWADRFFSIGESSRYLQFIDGKNATCALFEHLSDKYEWFEQLGALDWGGQQFAPAGEVSVLPLAHGNYNPAARLKINGQISLQGIPIVNSGKPSFLRADQEAIYQELKLLKQCPVIAEVESGEIVKLSCHDKQGIPIINMLEALFKVDSRYRIIWEIGFGTHFAMDIRDGNKAPNESYGNQNGCVHWGLGLTPWTQYHIDILCPQTTVLNDQNILLAGPVISEVANDEKIKRIKSPGCACNMFNLQ